MFRYIFIYHMFTKLPRLKFYISSVMQLMWNKNKNSSKIKKRLTVFAYRIYQLMNECDTSHETYLFRFDFLSLFFTYCVIPGEITAWEFHINPELAPAQITAQVWRHVTTVTKRRVYRLVGLTTLKNLTGGMNKVVTFIHRLQLPIQNLRYLMLFST